MNRLEALSLTTRSVLLHDRQAFGQLVVHYTPRLRRFFAMQLCGDMDTADDLVQDTLLKAWRSIGDFHMTASFGTWLYRIAYNRLTTHLRRRYPEWIALDEEVAAVEDESPPDNERGATLQHSIETLPPTQRLCVTMHYMQELSVKEISGITGMSPEAIRANLSRACRRLRQTMKDDERHT